jgi:L-lactate dehydrogenase complex protein LldE
VSFPPDQTCCGQPAFNAGYRDEARRVALHTLGAFEGAEAVVLPSGSCTSMVRVHYPELFATDPGALRRAEGLASRTYELSEFLVRVLGVERVGEGLAGRRVAYHHGCHALRELGVREEPLALLRNSGATLVDWPADTECCGFGGVFAVKFPEVSAAMADRKLDSLPPCDLLTSADPGCLLHLQGRLARRGMDIPVKHLAEVLWEAHREA